MKRILLATFIILTVLGNWSCKKFDDMKKADQELILETLETFVMTQNLTIDVPEGKIAVVTMKDTDDTMTIMTWFSMSVLTIVQLLQNQNIPLMISMAGLLSIRLLLDQPKS